MQEGTLAPGLPVGTLLWQGAHTSILLLLPADVGSVLKVVVLQKTSSAVTEEIVLEELQVFKVPFAALCLRAEGS